MTQITEQDLQKKIIASWDIITKAGAFHAHIPEGWFVSSKIDTVSGTLEFGFRDRSLLTAHYQHAPGWFPFVNISVADGFNARAEELFTEFSKILDRVVTDAEVKADAAPAGEDLPFHEAIDHLQGACP